MLSANYLRGAHRSCQGPSLQLRVLQQPIRRQLTSVAPSFRQDLARIPFRVCMAKNLPSSLGGQPGVEEAVHIAEKKLLPSFVDGVAPAQRLNLDALISRPGPPDVFSQAPERDMEESFEYDWDDCGKESEVRSSKLRVLTWNTLADGLAQHGEFVKVPSHLLEWQSRAPVLLRELVESGADIICLQEVNHFDDCFLPSLQKLGYSGRFQPKILSPSERFGYGSDGVALFYKTSRFEMHNFETLQFVDPSGDNMSQCALLCRLTDRESGDQLLLATTHLKAKTGPEHDATRALQIRQLLKRVSALAADSAVPVILCGDLNCDPESDVCASLRTHPLGLSDAFAEPAASTSGLHDSRDSSAEKGGGNGRAGSGCRPFTTWKFRPVGEKKETIDYIWYRGLDLVRRRKLPTSQAIGPSALPSSRHPSDHLPVCCELSWTR